MKGERKIIVNKVNARKPRLPKDVWKRDFTVEELKSKCKELGISPYSKLKEDELVEKIHNHLNQ